VIDVKPDRTTPLVVAPGGGTTLSPPVAGGVVTVKLPSETTAGVVTVWETLLSPGDTDGPGLHSHPGFDEIFYVLAGEYGFFAGGQRFTAPAGTLVFMPGSIFHVFAGTGDTEGRVLHFAVPGISEDALEELAFSKGGR
jgi:mannose-6-phosphate isomerase-like protein (cupin superfamily)